MKERKSNVEAMRILAVLLVICHHFSVHGGFYFQGTQITGNMLLVQLLSLGGKVGVNLFVLITGYFTVTAANTSRRRWLVIWKQIFFYSVVLYLLALVTGQASFSLRSILGAMFPVLSNQWWFASTWVFLSILSPVLNLWLCRQSKQGYLRYLLVFSLLWYLMPVLAWLPGRVRDLVWFVYLYSVAGYLRLHGKQSRGAYWLVWALAGLAAAFLLGWKGMADQAGAGQGFTATYFDAHHILILLSSIFLFRFGMQLDLGVKPWINGLARHSFGIYLIHDSDYFRYPLWQGLLKCGAWADSPWLTLYAAGCVAGVFCAGLILEMLRARLFSCFSFLDKGTGR